MVAGISTLIKDLKCGKAARRFLAWLGHGREPTSCAGGREQLRGAAGFSACPVCACGYPKCNVVMLPRISENTGAVLSSVSSGVHASSSGAVGG